MARVLEELYADRASELSATIARHYEVSGDGESAARCYLTAIRRSIGLGALDEAHSLGNRALALVNDLPLRAGILLEIETIERRRGNRAAQEAALKSLDQLAATVVDAGLESLILLRRIDLAVTVGNAAALETAICELRGRLPRDDVAWRLHIGESKLAFLLGRLAESYVSAEAALACSRATDIRAGIAQALCCMANVEAHRGNLSEAEALFDEAGVAGGNATDSVVENLSLTSAFSIAYNRRDIERCLALGQRWLERAVAIGDRVAEAAARGRLALALTATGTRYAEAREHFASAVHFYAEIGNESARAGELLNQAVLETRLGAFDKAVAATERAVEIFASLHDDRGRVIGLANLGFLRACAGNLVGAQSVAREARQLAHLLGFGLIEASALENLAFAEAAAGEVAQAIAHAEAALELRASSQSQVWASKNARRPCRVACRARQFDCRPEPCASPGGRRKKHCRQHRVARVLLLGSRSGFSSGKEGDRSLARTRPRATDAADGGRWSGWRRSTKFPGYPLARRHRGSRATRSLARPTALARPNALERAAC